MEQTIGELYDDKSWNAYSMGSEYFTRTDETQERTDSTLEAITENH